MKTSGNILDIKSDNLKDAFPEIAREWHPTKNGDLKPEDVTACSGKKVWWLCQNYHSYEARIADRSSGHGCPYCSGRKPIVGVNDLATLYPEIAKEWNYEKNNEMLPNHFKSKSKRKVWWKCQKGHEWEAVIKNRVNGSGCPYCARSKAYPGENDLLTRYPILSREWHKTKNEISTPRGIACYSNQKVWWVGLCGHEWQDTPSHRVMGRGCPVCNRQNKTSFPEQAILYYIRKQYPDAINGYNSIFYGAMELDIYIPILKLGIEYDGKAWHNTSKALEREIKKYSICKENGIRLIRVKEVKSHTDSITCDDIIYCKADLNQTIKSLAVHFPLSCQIDVDKDRRFILESYMAERKSNSFYAEFPAESREWHPTKNGALKPNMFSSGSGENVWWKCSKGHEWKMPIVERSHGNGCPYCSNHRVLTGYNDLLTMNPGLAKEWDKNMNYPKKPSDVLATSTCYAWWRCKRGHLWKARVNDRAKGRGCPYCANKRVLQGFNDLATTNPELLNEWDYERNIGVSPTEYTYGSSKKVWWKCKKCGHEWMSTIYGRYIGSGCPKCVRKQHG